MAIPSKGPHERGGGLERPTSLTQKSFLWDHLFGQEIYFLRVSSTLIWESWGSERFLGEIGLGSFVVALGWRERDWLEGA